MMDDDFGWNEREIYCWEHGLRCLFGMKMKVRKCVKEY